MLLAGEYGELFKRCGRELEKRHKNEMLALILHIKPGSPLVLLNDIAPIYINID